MTHTSYKELNLQTPVVSGAGLDFEPPKPPTPPPPKNGPKVVPSGIIRGSKKGKREQKCECHFKSRLSKSKIASKASDLRTKSQE